MKNFLIALFAIAVIATGAPLMAQEYEEPMEAEAEVEAEANLQAEDEFGTEDELATDDEFGTEDEFETDDEFGTEDDLGDDELPATGSELPLAALLGLLSLVGAVALRARS